MSDTGDPKAESRARHRALPDLIPIAPRVLRDQVRDALRDAILSGSFAPGTRIGEVETATALSVSRTPVREAIRELVQEGLLTFVAHRGAVVVTVSDDEIEASYRVKAVLEEEALARATVRLVPSQVTELRAIIAVMATQAALGAFAAANAAEGQFHAKIADIAQLGMLRRTWASIDDLGRLSTAQLMVQRRSFPRYLDAVARLHADLLDVMLAGDPETSARAGREHLEEMHRLFSADLTAAPAKRTVEKHERSLVTTRAARGGPGRP